MNEQLVQIGKNREPERFVNQRTDGTPLRDLFMDENLLVADHRAVEDAKNTMAVALEKATLEEIKQLETLPEAEARTLAMELVARRIAS